jgi:hypothetical protein
LNLQANQGSLGASISIVGGTNGNILLTTQSGGVIQFSSNMTGSTPSNTTTPSGWLKVYVGSNLRYIPYYT